MTDTDKTDTNFTPEFQSEEASNLDSSRITIPGTHSGNEKIVLPLPENTSDSETGKSKENKRLKSVRAIMEAKPNRAGQIIFTTLLIFGLVYTALNVFTDINKSAIFGGPAVTAWLYFLLGTGLLIALGFEFVNGFHDTANAVATVIYTHSLPPHFAVIWSGVFNFLGVLFSSGAVAFGIISLLPVELIMQVGGGAGFAMVFALLIAAIIWNLGTWWLGLPASSSHTLIGSIMGVGIANALMRGRDGASGIDWAQATKIGWSLLLSPLVGFGVAAILLLVMKLVIKKRKLFREPKGKKPPPLWIRGLLIMTCTGVSFAHGSNDGQKGMGLIMLILIGTIPTTYGLNRTMPHSQTTQFIAMAEVTQRSLEKMSPAPFSGNSRAILTDYIRTKNYTPQTLPALSSIIGEISYKVKLSGSLSKVPAASVTNVRNDMYLVSETVSRLDKGGKLSTFAKEDRENVKSFKGMVDKSTKYIPIWVKAAVAIALGLGTMVGWRRIVTTVGERIGKTHLTYAQGAAAELTAMATIMAADNFGLPVSTTHVVSSGIAGTMTANGSGLQLGTVRNLLMAWLLTLPAAILLSGTLYWIFSQFVK